MYVEYTEWFVSSHFYDAMMVYIFPFLFILIFIFQFYFFFNFIFHSSTTIVHYN